MDVLYVTPRDTTTTTITASSNANITGNATGMFEGFGRSAGRLIDSTTNIIGVSVIAAYTLARTQAGRAMIFVGAMTMGFGGRLLGQEQAYRHSLQQNGFDLRRAAESQAPHAPQAITQGPQNGVNNFTSEGPNDFLDWVSQFFDEPTLLNDITAVSDLHTINVLHNKMDLVIFILSVVITFCFVYVFIAMSIVKYLPTGYFSAHTLIGRFSNLCLRLFSFRYQVQSVGLTVFIFCMLLTLVTFTYSQCTLPLPV